MAPCCYGTLMQMERFVTFCFPSTLPSPCSPPLLPPTLPSPCSPRLAPPAPLLLLPSPAPSPTPLSLLFYLNSPTRSDGTMLLWGINGDGEVCGTSMHFSLHPFPYSIYPTLRDLSNIDLIFKIEKKNAF